MGTNDINSKDEFRLQWLLDGAVVGESPKIWQKESTAISHGDGVLRLLKDEFGIEVPGLTYRVQMRMYNVSRQGWQ